jgi:hypothetical protein
MFKRKIEKYKQIIEEAKGWLQANREDICIKHKVSRVSVVVKLLIISNLGIVPKFTEDDVCSIISSDKNERLRYGRMWLKRMINQAIRGSFECYVNVDKVADLDHVTEVNEDITNLNDSINVNLYALNEEIGFDLKFREKLSVKDKKFHNDKLINPKHFIIIPNLDRDVVLEKNVMQTIANLPETDELNIVIEPEVEPKPKETFLVVGVDDSNDSETSDGEEESEVMGNNSIFDGHSKRIDQIEYVKNVCIPGLPNLELWLENLKRDAIIIAD